MDRAAPLSRMAASPAPSGATPSGASAAMAGPREKVPPTVFLMLICVLLIPIEINMQIGPLFMTPSKAFLVIVTFVILPRLATLRWQFYDWMITAHVALCFAAYTHVYGASRGIEIAGTYMLETLIVYLVARIYILSLGQVLAVIGMLFWMVALNALAALPSALTGRHYVHEFARSLTGFWYPYSSEVRLGIHRSVGFFEHSILLGVFCASTLALVWYTSRPAQRVWKVPVILAGTFFAASSAPLMVFMLQLVMIGIERVTRRIKNRLAIFTGCTAFLVIFLENASNRGFVGVLSMFVVNPYTTYYRRAQWEYAIDDVLRHPWLGFDAPTWTRPSWMLPSIDNHWLAVMMRTGIPSLITLFACILFIWFALSRRKPAPALYVNIRTGWGMIMVALLLAGSTVTFFGKAQPMLAFLIGLGAALANCTFPETSRENPADEPSRTRRPAVPYTRFGPGTARPGPARTHPAAPASFG